MRQGSRSVASGQTTRPAPRECRTIHTSRMRQLLGPVAAACGAGAVGHPSDGGGAGIVPDGLPDAAEPTGRRGQDRGLLGHGREAADGDRVQQWASARGPAAAAAAIVQLAASEEPPLRLQLDSDCVASVESKLDTVRDELDRWRELSRQHRLPGRSLLTLTVGGRLRCGGRRTAARSARGGRPPRRSAALRR